MAKKMTDEQQCLAEGKQGRNETQTLKAAVEVIKDIDHKSIGHKEIGILEAAKKIIHSDAEQLKSNPDAKEEVAKYAAIEAALGKALGSKDFSTAKETLAGVERLTRQHESTDNLMMRSCMGTKAESAGKGH